MIDIKYIYYEKKEREIGFKILYVEKKRKINFDFFIFWHFLIILVFIILFYVT